jgi:taurine dioxygenase
MSTSTLTKVKISPIDAPLGAIVTDLDASQAIAPEVILQLKEALRDRHILIFKDQFLSCADFLKKSNINPMLA